jgi:hypothetical protein
MCPNFRVFLRERVFNCIRLYVTFLSPQFWGHYNGTEESVFIRVVYMLISRVSLGRERFNCMWYAGFSLGKKVMSGGSPSQAE